MYFLKITPMQPDKQELYIFEGLSQKEVAYFIMMSETMYFDEGTTIMSEGDESDDRAYFIESGTVDVFRHGKKISSMGPGDVFWELALITNEPRAATIVATSDMEVLAFNKEEFIMLYQKSGMYEDIKWKILKRVKNNFYGIADPEE